MAALSSPCRRYNLKVYSIQNWKFCHHLLTLKLLQTCMTFFVLINTKEYILKNDWKIGTKLLESMEINGAKAPIVQSMVQNTVSSFVFSRRKKLIQFCNNLRVT